MKKKTIAIISNDSVWTYNLRREIIQALLDVGYRVTVIVGYGQRIEDLKKMGCDFIDIPVDRHGVNPFRELWLARKYHKALKELQPDAVLTYTLKPNIYGGYVCSRLKIPFIANVTGLGTAVENEGLMQKIVMKMLRFGLKHASMVFFQNTENQQFFIDKKIAVSAHDLLPGSGVNLQRYAFTEYPTDDVIKFAFVSRIMREKGIDQYLEAAEYISHKYPNVEFHICGFCEAEYNGKLQQMSDMGVVKYHGMIRDVAGFMSNMNAIIHPTYYPEGISNVLLESCAIGRPIITTDRSGCREVVDDGVNGFVIPQKNSQALIDAIERFLELNFEQKQKMGVEARAKVEREFDRNIVVQRYVDIVREVTS